VSYQNFLAVTLGGSARFRVVALTLFVEPV